MKKFLVLIAVCFFVISPHAFAENEFGTDKKYVIDEAFLLSPEEEEKIEEEIITLREKYKFDLVILTVNSLKGKSSMEYADDYYDYNGYGYGKNYDGALLLISIGTLDGTGRQGWISTSGKGIDIIDDENISSMGENLSELLSDNKFFDAGISFVSMCENELMGSKLTKWIISAIIGLALSIIIVFTMRLGMNTAVKMRAASDYIKKDSLNITESKDLYMFSTVSRVKKAEKSSTHTGSSGRSHGGGGFSF